MTALTPQVFVPPSLQSGEIIAHIHALAAQQGKSSAFVADKASDTVLAGQATDVTIFQELDFESLTPIGSDWTIALPSTLESCVAFFKMLQPDQPDHWALTHGSGAATAAYWLHSHGAQALAFDSLDSDPAAPDVSAAAKYLEDIYEQWPIPIAKSWDWREPLIASSPAYLPDQDGWVNLTGRARHVLSGPFIFLLPGIWKIEMDVEVDVETGVPRLAFQWGGAALEKTVFTTLLRRSGRYQVTLEAKITRPDAAHAMVATDAAQLQGFLRLKGMKLTYLSPLEA